MTSDPSISQVPRAGEPGAVAAIAKRTNRLFQLPGGWYFNTREQVTLGPFAAPERAEVALADFIAFITSAPPRLIALFKRRRGFIPSGTAAA